MTARRSGGEVIVESLLAHGVDTLFAIPGVQTYYLFDALYRAQDRVRVIAPRHEQAAAYMAYGYAKSTGKVGVYSVVPGPGVLNSTAALCTAYGASTPVVCITGQVPLDSLGLGKGYVHELPDQLATLRTLTKWAARMEHPAQASALIAEAFRQATSGRPGPVALEMPWDVFGMQAPALISPPLPQPPPIEPDPDQIARAAEVLGQARNPMIMVGGGAVHAGAEILEVAETLQAPVVSLRSGRGIVSDEHYLGFNCAAGYQRWAETDVLLALGTRLELQWFRWHTQPAGLRIILIDVDPRQKARLRPTISVVGDARTSAAALMAALRKSVTPRPSRREEFTRIKERTRSEIQRVRPYVQYLQAIRDVLPRDGFLVEEICQAGFASTFAFPVYETRKFVTGGYQGTLGFGFPTALGVKVANPDKAVVSLAGDGGFQFGLQELATAVQYGIPLVSIVFNNSAYGNVLKDQRRLFAGRTIASELRNPDFVALADSYGMCGYRVNTPEQLRPVLERALGEARATLIEVPVNDRDEASPWEFLIPQAQGK